MIGRLVIVDLAPGPGVQHGPYRGAVRIDYESDGALRISTRRWGVIWTSVVYYPATDGWVAVRIVRALGEADRVRAARARRL